MVAAAPSDGLVAAAEALVTATETYLDTQRSPGMWGTDRGRLHQAAQNLRAALATPEPSAEADAALTGTLATELLDAVAADLEHRDGFHPGDPCAWYDHRDAVRAAYNAVVEEANR